MESLSTLAVRQSPSIGVELSSHTKILSAHTLAVSCACGLVCASMGFGAVYAWQTGSEHSIALGCLTVLFAVCLEGVKPLAIASAFKALGSLKLASGLALSLLGLVAVAYSLTAELSLIAQVRSDIASERTNEGYKTRATQSAYEDARRELSELEPSRAIGEIEADILKLKAENPKAKNCPKLDGPISRLVCPKIATLEGEIDRQKRRQELQLIISKHTTTIVTTHETVREANPAVSSWAVVLSLMGIVVSLDTIAQLLNLVPVIALELGSALALVLVNAFTPQVTVPMAVGTTTLAADGDIVSEPHMATPQVIEPPVVDLQSSAPASPTPPKRTPRDKTSRALVDWLNDLPGGTTIQSERALAKIIGSERNTVRRVIHELANSGLLTAKPSRRGTVLTLL